MSAVAESSKKMEVLGASLSVENVQLLSASKNLTDIPNRYIRPELELAPILAASEAAQTPIIDLARLVDPKYSQQEVTKLGLACEYWGFFQVVNHGVADEVIERMKDGIQAFFNLPFHEKKMYAQLPGSLEGYGQAFVVSEEQKLDWGDMFFLSTLPLPTRNTKLWPTKPPTFRTALDEYSLELQRVANILLESIAKSLGVKETSRMISGIQAMRMNYYPACPQASKVLGLSPHSDGVSLTLLLQVNPVQGLQIKKNGGWITIDPLPVAFIVNIGDIIEIMSNGKYKSIEHRAVINPENERISVAAFHAPAFDVQVGPLPELVKGEEELYRKMTTLDYFKLVTANKLEGKSMLDHMKLKK